MAANRVYFGEFELDASNYELRRSKVPVKLERIPMELLILLVRNSGRLVQRTQIVETIWGKNHFLETDSAINTAVRKVRDALGDDPKRPFMIETVPSKGYRFVATEVRPDAPPDARGLYAKGLHFWNRKTPASYIEAIRLYQASIDLDSHYAMPHLGLAKTWVTLGIHGLQPSHHVYPRARVAAAKALELDERLAEAFVVIADIRKGYDWDWKGAEAYYLRALEIDAGCSLAHHWYANLLSILGRHEEALCHAMEARCLEPLSVGITGFVGFTYLRAGRFMEALRESQSALTLEPDSPIANWFLAQALMALKRFPEAGLVLSTAVEHSSGAPMYLSAQGFSYAAGGERQRASDILQRLQQLSVERYVSPVDLAIITAALGDAQGALTYLESAANERVMRLTELRMPMFDSLRTLSGFKGLLARMGLNGS